MNLQRPVALNGFTPGRLDVFWCATDQSSIKQTTSTDGTTWQTAVIAQSDGPFSLAPAIYSDQPGKMDIGWADANSQLWYMSWNGSQWTNPAQLNPSAMTAPDGWGAAEFRRRFSTGPCAGPLNRRSSNTEFLICDNQLRAWSLSTDGSTWFVADGQNPGLVFPPAQVRMATTGGGPSALCRFWCTVYDGILRTGSGTIPFDFDLANDFPLSIAGALQTITENGAVGQVFNTVINDWFNSLPLFGPHRIGYSPLNSLNLGALPDTRFRAMLPEMNARPETLEFARLHPPGTSQGARDDERRLNRLILEDAANGQIAKTPLQFSAFFGPLSYEPAVIARTVPAGEYVDLLYFDQIDLWNGRWHNGLLTIRSIWQGQRGRSSPEPAAPLPAGGSGALHVLWRTVGGQVMDTFEGPTGWTTTIVTNASGASHPGGAVDAQGGVHAFWLGTDGNLYMTSSSSGTNWAAPTVIASSR